MKNKYLFFSSISLIVAVLCFVILFSGKDTEKVETVLSKEYQGDAGSLKNYGQEEPVQYLSESIGQYMEYLLLVNNQQEFDHQVTVLQNNFLVEQDAHVFIKWQLTDNTTTNAAVDDLRIIGALFEAGKVFEEPRYTLLAEKLTTSLLAVQKNQDILTDFYDWQEKQLASTVHLSYINFDLMDVMSSLDKDYYIRILKNSLNETPFFTEIFLPEEEHYQSSNETEISLIDQFLIALQYHKATGQNPTAFNDWIKTEWRRNGKLYGRYGRISQDPVVNYESSSVYALALLYFMETGQPQYAQQLYTILLEQPLFSENADYSSIHIFDYLFAHTAATAFDQSLQ